MIPEDLLARRFGEVVESSTTSFVAQCYRIDDAPSLGALVRTNEPHIYAVVSQITTEPLDTTRPVLARGEYAASEDELLRGSPQLSRLLTSRIEAAIVAHGAIPDVRQHLPPAPPMVHSFVYSCSAPEGAPFIQAPEFLHLLTRVSAAHADEVVTACLRRLAASQADPGYFLSLAGRALAVELAGDVARLNHILRRVTL